MSKNKIALVLGGIACASALSGSVHAQTIQELTDAARMKKLMELRGHNTAPSQQMPTGMPFPGGAMPPQAAQAPTNPAPTETPKKTSHADLYLLSIYGIGDRLIAEIADDGTAAKYRVGDVTPGGWTVASIQKRQVVLRKNGKRKKGGATKTLSFWEKIDEDLPASTNAASRTASGAPSALVNPPFPPGMFGRQ